MRRRCSLRCRSDAGNLNACVADFISFASRPNQTRIKENNMHGQRGAHLFFGTVNFFALLRTAPIVDGRKEWIFFSHFAWHSSRQMVSTEMEKKSMLQFNSHRTKYFDGCANEMPHSRHCSVLIDIY